MRGATVPSNGGVNPPYVKKAVISSNEANSQPASSSWAGIFPRHDVHGADVHGGRIVEPLELRVVIQDGPPRSMRSTSGGTRAGKEHYGTGRPPDREIVAERGHSFRIAGNMRTRRKRQHVTRGSGRWPSIPNGHARPKDRTAEGRERLIIAGG